MGVMTLRTPVGFALTPTIYMWQFWVSETLQKRLSNTSEIVKCCARRCGALLAHVRVCLAAAVCDS
jgi:hypothetical protein